MMSKGNRAAFIWICVVLCFCAHSAFGSAFRSQEEVEFDCVRKLFPTVRNVYDLLTPELMRRLTYLLAQPAEPPEEDKIVPNRGHVSTLVEKGGDPQRVFGTATHVCVLEGDSAFDYWITPKHVLDLNPRLVLSNGKSFHVELTDDNADFALLSAPRSGQPCITPAEALVLPMAVDPEAQFHSGRFAGIENIEIEAPDYGRFAVVNRRIHAPLSFYAEKGLAGREGEAYLLGIRSRGFRGQSGASVIGCTSPVLDPKTGKYYGDEVLDHFDCGQGPKSKPPALLGMVLAVDVEGRSIATLPGPKISELIAKRFQPTQWRALQNLKQYKSPADVQAVDKILDPIILKGDKVAAPFSRIYTAKAVPEGTLYPEINALHYRGSLVSSSAAPLSFSGGGRTSDSGGGRTSDGGGGRTSDGGQSTSQSRRAEISGLQVGTKRWLSLDYDIGDFDFAREMNSKGIGRTDLPLRSSRHPLVRGEPPWTEFEPLPLLAKDMIASKVPLEGIYEENGKLYATSIEKSDFRWAYYENFNSYLFNMAPDDADEDIFHNKGYPPCVQTLGMQRQGDRSHPTMVILCERALPNGKGRELYLSQLDPQNPTKGFDLKVTMKTESSWFGDPEVKMEGKLLPRNSKDQGDPFAKNYIPDYWKKAQARDFSTGGVDVAHNGLRLFKAGNTSILISRYGGYEILTEDSSGKKVRTFGPINLNVFGTNLIEADGTKHPEWVKD